jgi:hypothetical protein
MKYAGDDKKTVVNSPWTAAARKKVPKTRTNTKVWTYLHSCSTMSAQLQYDECTVYEHTVYEHTVHECTLHEHTLHEHTLHEHTLHEHILKHLPSVEQFVVGD